MSETKERTLETIREEYSQLCARAGHMQYQLHVITKDLEVLNNTIRDLNFEASSLQAKEGDKS